jgi:phenylacetate-coenzyme A ligase PaaK-like adenylate-forming protein
MDVDCFNPKVETMAAGEIREIQEQKLRREVQWLQF